MRSRQIELAAFQREIARQNQDFDAALAALDELEPKLEFRLATRVFEELEALCASSSPAPSTPFGSHVRA